MRSAEAGTVPDSLAYRRPCAQHHALCPCTRTAFDPCDPARSLRGPRREVSGHCRPRLPEIAADAVSVGSPRLHPWPRRYGINPSPFSSGYLASEHAK
jgi:hypothetical protein